MKTINHIVIVITILSLLASTYAFAGTTGKVIGKVTDEKKEALVGVNVVVKGTTRGAVTDPDGNYSIIGVPNGSYTIQARQIGYRTMEVTDVKVLADQTTALDFQLQSSAVEVGVYVVTANQTLVNKLVTSTTQTMNKEKIEQIPGAKNVQDVIKIQAGVIKQGNSYFLRGGRANEVQYVVDGVPVNNLVGNSGDLVGTSSANKALSALYSGMASGAIGGESGGLQVSSNAIQDVSVQSSGFDADFGNAQSGIVNITTKSGGENLTASVQYRTDKISNTNQNEVYQSFNLGGPEPISKFLLPGLGIKIPGNLTFFFNADISRSDGAYTYTDNEFYHPLGRKVELNGFLGGILNGLGFTYYDYLRNSFTFSSKLRYDISSTDQVAYSYNASLNSSHGYVNSWKYFADSSSLGASLSTQHSIAWSHFFGQKSFIKFNIAKVEKHDGNDIAGLTPADYSAVYSGTDPNGDGFTDLGMSQRWYSSITKDWQIRFDYNSQIHPLHMFKTGFEFHYEELNSTEIVQPTAAGADSNGDVIYPPFPDYLGRNRGLYPGYGTYRWVLNNYPNRGAFYLQDNIEFSGLTLHLGLRYDYIDLGRQIYYSDFWEAWVDAVNPPGTTSEAKLTPQWILDQGMENGQLRDGRFLSDSRRLWYYITHGYISPRLAINYPVTERIAFYFNYGHFLQYPERDQYFRDPYVVGTGSWVGNPDLKPQRTVAYEAGFDDQFTDDMAFKVRAFYKDIFDYVTNVPRLSISLYRNLDYSSVRGFEVSFDQALTGNFWATFNYSYQIAKGRSSNTNAAIFQPDFQLPRETRLDFDQTHTINVFTTYKVGPKEEGQFFGLPFINNYGISLTWSYGSGFPYTPYTASRNNIQDQYLKNNNTRPHTSTVNLSLYKGLLLFQKINAIVTLDVTNLFNRRNVSTGDASSGFNTVDGRPYQFGDYNPASETKYIYQWNQMGSLIPPYVFDPPRQVLLGFKFNWN